MQLMPASSTAMLRGYFAMPCSISGVITEPSEMPSSTKMVRMSGTGTSIGRPARAAADTTGMAPDRYPPGTPVRRRPRPPATARASVSAVRASSDGRGITDKAGTFAGRDQCPAREARSNKDVLNLLYWTGGPNCADLKEQAAIKPLAASSFGESMLQGWVVIAVALAYIGLLFLIASYGDRTRRLARSRMRLMIYPLSLAIYCTSWTFFGSVGSASRTGYEFLTIYIGPVLMIGLFSPLLARIVRLAKAQNITSIADFIAARYGKGQAVAATVALIAIVGTVPYIALQLKAVSASLETIIAHISPGHAIADPLLGDIALFVALSMATFAVLFGTRHIDATEHQDGLMLAIATESMVKLVAFLAVGIFVTFWMFDGPVALFHEAMQRPSTAAIFGREPRIDTLVAMTLLS